MPPSSSWISACLDEFDKLVWLLPTPDRTPGVCCLLERAAHSVARTIGQIPAPPSFPVLPRRTGRASTCYFFVLLAVRPMTLAYHEQLGIPEPVSRRTLVDLGRRMSVHRKNYGKGGIDTPSWLTHHMRASSTSWAACSSACASATAPIWTRLPKRVFHSRRQTWRCRCISPTSPVP